MTRAQWVEKVRASLSAGRRRLTEPVPTEDGVAVDWEDGTQTERPADRPDEQGGAGPVAR